MFIGSTLHFEVYIDAFWSFVPAFRSHLHILILSRAPIYHSLGPTKVGLQHFSTFPLNYFTSRCLGTGSWTMSLMLE